MKSIVVALFTGRGVETGHALSVQSWAIIRSNTIRRLHTFANLHLHILPPGSFSCTHIPFSLIRLPFV
jgi:hypothetical protein